MTKKVGGEGQAAAQKNHGLEVGRAVVEVSRPMKRAQFAIGPGPASFLPGMASRSGRALRFMHKSCYRSGALSI